MKKIVMILFAVFVAFTAISQPLKKVNPADLSETAKAQFKTSLGITAIENDTLPAVDYFYTEAEVNSLLSNRPQRIWPSDGAASGLPVSLTGTLAETTVLTFSLDASKIGTNGCLSIQGLFYTSDNSVNQKHIRVKFNGTTVMYTRFEEWQKLKIPLFLMFCNNSKTSQYAAATVGPNDVIGTSGNDFANYSFDFNSPITVTVTIINSNIAYTTTIRNLQIFIQ